MLEGWTYKDGVANSSDEFLRLVEEVGRLLDGQVFSLAQGHEGRRQTARLILAQLAHVQGLAPTTHKAGKEG